MDMRMIDQGPAAGMQVFGREAGEEFAMARAQMSNWGLALIQNLLVRVSSC
jgi:hypothetical protein